MSEPAQIYTSSISLEKLLKYISLASVFFYLGSIAYHIYYYQAFNINIVEYIDLSESLLLFIPFLLKILIVSIILTPLLFLYFFFIRKAILRIFAKHNPKIMSRSDIIFISMTGVIFVITMAFYPKSFMGISRDLMILTQVLLVAFNCVIFLNNYFINMTTIMPKTVFYSLLFAIVFVVYLFINCNSRINGVKNHEYKFEAVLTLNDSTKIITDSANLYVGQTRNYFFIYSQKNKTSTVISKTKETKIEIKELPDSE